MMSQPVNGLQATDRVRAPVCEPPSAAPLRAETDIRLSGDPRKDEQGEFPLQANRRRSAGADDEREEPRGAAQRAPAISHGNFYNPFTSSQ